ncbi:MAG: hypothetical protein A2Z52_02190 [Candidatus Moranbacteria bacterium RBG_19FT_COMBO_42_6]|nr:MAG: hypothetical protein A2Z52_02190 [Candidatus Moranbacteria bacterium RBG_19FT_COMBO_42_6]
MIAIIIFIAYFIFVAAYLLTSFFIVYHLASYSINPELRIVTLSLFILVSGGLLFSNLVLFFSMNWDAIMSGINF